MPANNTPDVLRHTRSRTSNRHSWLAVLPILLITAWIGIGWLNEDILWVDEIFSFERSGGSHYGALSVGGVIETTLNWDNWPPLYHLTLHYWGSAVGWTLFEGRALSFFAGLLTVAMVYRLGAEMGTRSAGLFAAAYLGISAFFGYYLHEMRGYMLHALLATVLLWAYWRAVQPTADPNQRLSLSLAATLILASTALLYSHPTAIPEFAMLGLYHLLFAPRGTRWWHTLEMFTISGTLFLPWAMVSLPAWVLNDARVSYGMDLATFAEAAITTFSNGYPLLLAIFAAGILVLLRVRSRAIGLVVFWTLSILIFSLVANAVEEYLFHIRHVLVLLPLTALLVGLAWDRLLTLQPRLAIPVVLLLVAWGAAGVYQSRNPDFHNDLPNSTPTVPRAEFMRAVARVTAEFAPGDIVIFQIGLDDKVIASHKVMEHYFYGTDVQFAHAEYLDDSNAENPATIAQMRAYLASAPHVWTLIETTYDSAPELTVLNTVLADGYTLCFADNQPNTVRLSLYARGACPTASVAQTH